MNQKRLQSKTRLFLAFAVLLLFQCLSVAQTKYGNLEGVVTDSTTQEVLFGTSVQIENTSLGAATDLDGEFKINHIKTGTYNVIIRYIGYEQKIIPVEIREDKTTKLDIKLIVQAIEGQEIVVTAQAKGQKEAINQQLSSPTIVNIVSSEKIHQLPDDNAATALSRLPGVSLMNGDQVVIRGVEAKLNQILVNGIQLPSTDMYNRSTNLGFISSNMLSGIEVIKAITPDMDANTIGGVVNLRLRQAAPDLHFDVLTQGNYNYSDRTGGDYKFWMSVSDRFFDDKLGVFIQANSDRSDGGNQYASIAPSYDAIGGDVYGASVYKTNTSTMEYDRDIVNTKGGSIILDYTLPNGKIILQNTYAATFTDQRHNKNNMDFVNSQVHYYNERKKYGKDIWISALQAEYSFGDLKTEASLSHSYTDLYTRFAYDDAAQQIDFINNTTVQHPFGVDAASTPISYKSNAEQRKITMQKAFQIFDNMDQSDAYSATLEGQPSSTKNAFKQHLYSAALDFTLPVNFSKDLTSIFKAGGKFSRTTRDNDYDKSFSGASDDDTYANVLNYFPDRPRSGSNRLKLTDVMGSFEQGKYFMKDEYDFKNGFKYTFDPGIFDNWLATSQAGWTPALKMDDSWRNDFSGAETFTAGYLMGTFNILHNITLLGGIRYENYNMNYHSSLTVTIHNVYGNAISTKVGTIDNVPANMYNVNRSDENFFPNAQLRYKPNEWSDLRFAYTSGISRPDYLAIIPKVWIFPSGNQFELGNPKLRPATAQNLDLIASVYSNEIGLFTINGFYKELKDVQYSTTIYYGNISMYSENDISVPSVEFLNTMFSYNPPVNATIGLYYNNPNKGYIRGIEVDWQTNFWYLPEPFNSLVLDINYTKSTSHTNYRLLRNRSERVYNELTHKYDTNYYTIDTVYSGRMVQQADDVINAALGIDYKGFSGRLSFNMRGNVMNSVGTRPEETSYTGNIYRWDFTLKQNLPFEGLSVSISGVNIFHNPVKTYRKYKLEADAPVTENLISVLYGPTMYQFNVRYSF
jgi:TonB-dependent receptor